jgi:hypothetical protein
MDLTARLTDPAEVGGVGDVGVAEPPPHAKANTASRSREASFFICDSSR